jgi:hypothetical protein
MSSSHGSWQKLSTVSGRLPYLDSTNQAYAAVYATDDRLGSSFLRNTQAILRELAKLGDDLAASPELKPGNSSPVGRVSATLNLCYHQVCPKFTYL